jgi:putative SOS response-associated peptidase YedK
MCYAYKPVAGEDGKIYKVTLREFRQLEQQGIIKPSSDGYLYAKATVGALLLEDGETKVKPMRWDLIPRDYLSEYPELTLAELIKKKNSRAKNPDTQKPWGYDSFNGRKETLASRPTFRRSWKEGKRCVMPAVAFQERANMEGAPAEFKNRSWQVELDRPVFMGGIWDRIERHGESLDSCTIITMDSGGHEKLRSIWHERHPLILTEDQVEEWLEPKTPMERARQMVMQFDPDRMTVTEIIKKPKSAPSE